VHSRIFRDGIRKMVILQLYIYRPIHTPLHTYSAINSFTLSAAEAGT